MMRKHVIIVTDTFLNPYKDLKHYFNFRGIEVSFLRGRFISNKRLMRKIGQAMDVEAKNTLMLIGHNSTLISDKVFPHSLKAIIYLNPNLINNVPIRQFVLQFEDNKELSTKQVTFYNLQKELQINNLSDCLKSLPLFGKFISGIV